MAMSGGTWFSTWAGSTPQATASLYVCNENSLMPKFWNGLICKKSGVQCVNLVDGRVATRIGSSLVLLAISGLIYRSLERETAMPLSRLFWWLTGLPRKPVLFCQARRTPDPISSRIFMFAFVVNCSLCLALAASLSRVLTRPTDAGLWQESCRIQSPKGGVQNFVTTLYQK